MKAEPQLGSGILAMPKAKLSVPVKSDGIHPHSGERHSGRR